MSISFPPLHLRIQEVPFVPDTFSCPSLGIADHDPGVAELGFQHQPRTPAQNLAREKVANLAGCSGIELEGAVRRGVDGQIGPVGVDVAIGVGEQVYAAAARRPRATRLRPGL